jgi:hypothetical protein
VPSPNSSATPFQAHLNAKSHRCDPLVSALAMLNLRDGDRENQPTVSPNIRSKPMHIVIIGIVVLFILYNLVAYVWNFVNTGKKPPFDWPK